MDLINDVHLGLSVHRHVAHTFSQLADIVHGVVGGPIDLDHVGVGARQDFFATRAHATR